MSTPLSPTGAPNRRRNPNPIDESHPLKASGLSWAAHKRAIEEGAAFPLQGMTAQYLMYEYRKPAPGDVVLVHAAAGGVGRLVVQWAKHLGPR